MEQNKSNLSLPTPDLIKQLRSQLLNFFSSNESLIASKLSQLNPNTPNSNKLQITILEIYSSTQTSLKPGTKLYYPIPLPNSVFRIYSSPHDPFTLINNPSKNPSELVLCTDTKTNKLLITVNNHIELEEEGIDPIALLKIDTEKIQNQSIYYLGTSKLQMEIIDNLSLTITVLTENTAQSAYFLRFGPKGIEFQGNKLSNCITIGRVRTNDIIIPDSLISGTHCTITFTQAWTIQDAHSRNSL
jgi:hypothetical protein